MAFPHHFWAGRNFVQGLGPRVLFFHRVTLKKCCPVQPGYPVVKKLWGVLLLARLRLILFFMRLPGVTRRFPKRLFEVTRCFGGVQNKFGGFGAQIGFGALRPVAGFGGLQAISRLALGKLYRFWAPKSCCRKFPKPVWCFGSPDHFWAGFVAFPDHFWAGVGGLLLGAGFGAISGLVFELFRAVLKLAWKSPRFLARGGFGALSDHFWAGSGALRPVLGWPF